MELNEQIEELEEQQAQIEAQLNGAQDSDEYARITNELNIVRNRLSEKREELRQQQEKEQARAEDIEERVNAEPVPFTALGIDLGGMPVELVKLIEDVYRTTLRNAYNVHAIELDQMEAECDRRVHHQIREYNELEAHLKLVEANEEKLGNEVNRLESELNEAILERDDAIEKRDAAVREKEENDLGLRTLLQMCEKERDELRAKLEQYEKAAEYQARQDQPISMGEDEKNTLQASADAVKKLFARAEDWGSVIKAVKPDGTFERVSRAEFQEEWAPVPPELPSFREEDSIADVEDNTVSTPEAPAAVTEDTFQGDVLAGHSNTDAGETESGEVTRAEFEALKAIVHKHELYISDLEASKGMNEEAA